MVRAPHRSSQCGFAALDYIGRCGGWAEDGVSGPTTYRFGQGTWLRPTYFNSPRHQRRAGSIWPSGTEAANPALCPFHSLQTGFSEKGRLRPRRRPARRVSPARKPVKLFLRRRQLLDSGHYQALAWVVGASAGAAWITATADNGLVGFQKAAQRPGRSSLSPCRKLCAILRDGRYPPVLWSHDRQPRSSPPSRCGSLRSPHRIAMRFDRKVGRIAVRNVTAYQGAPAARQPGSSHTNCRRQITSGPAGPESLRKSAERNIGPVQYHHHFL